MIGHYSQRLQQGLSPERSMANKGGGGSSAPYYENMNKLYGEQARAAGYMLDQSMPFIPQYMDNSRQMVSEAMSGELGNRMRQQTGMDADAASGNQLAAMNRNLAQYGINPNSGAFADMAYKSSVMNAANKVGAMNRAGQWAEDQKWNRNAGAFGQATGMSSGAMSSLGSSAAGYGAAGNAMMANDAANAQGMGMFGAAMAKGMMAADGGYIEGKAVRMASGGDPWANYKARNPIGLSSPSKQKTSNQLGLMAAGAAPYLLGSGIKAGLKSEFFKDNVVEPVKDSLKSLVGKDYYSTAANTINQAKAGVEGSPEFAKALPEPDLSALQTPTDYSSAFGATDAPGLQSVAQGSTDVGYNLMSDAAKPASDFVVQDIGQSIVQAGAEEASKQAAEELAASAIGNALLAADGGYVKKPGLKLAMGGLAKSMRMPGVASLDASSQMKVSSQPTKIKMPSTAKGPGLAQQQVQSTMSPGDALQGGKTGYDMAESAEKANQATNTAIDAADTTTNATEAAATASDTAQVAGTTADAAQTAGTTADATGAAADGAGPAGSIIKAGVDILSGRDAGTAVADAASSYAGAQAGATIGSVAGPVGTVIGGVLGGVLGGSIFKDGGSVGPTLRQGRVDHTEGGEVEGPGTETSDDIPAWLSKGEYVLNSQAVKMVGKDKLDQINEAGLKARKKSPTLAMARGGYAKKGC